MLRYTLYRDVIPRWHRSRCVAYGNSRQSSKRRALQERAGKREGGRGVARKYWEIRQTDEAIRPLRLQPVSYNVRVVFHTYKLLRAYAATCYADRCRMRKRERQIGTVREKKKIGKKKEKENEIKKEYVDPRRITPLFARTCAPTSFLSRKNYARVATSCHRRDSNNSRNFLRRRASLDPHLRRK